MIYKLKPNFLRRSNWERSDKKQYGTHGNI